MIGWFLGGIAEGAYRCQRDTKTFGPKISRCFTRKKSPSKRRGGRLEDRVPSQFVPRYRLSPFPDFIPSGRDRQLARWGVRPINGDREGESTISLVASSCWTIRGWRSFGISQRLDSSISSETLEKMRKLNWGKMSAIASEPSQTSNHKRTDFPSPINHLEPNSM